MRGQNTHHVQRKQVKERFLSSSSSCDPLEHKDQAPKRKRTRESRLKFIPAKTLMMMTKREEDCVRE